MGLWFSALLGWIAAAIKMKVPPHHVFLNTGKREMREFPRNARIARRVLGRTHAKIKDTPTINTSRALQKYSRQR